jgi:hypothetical protein
MQLHCKILQSFNTMMQCNYTNGAINCTHGAMQLQKVAITLQTFAKFYMLVAKLCNKRLILANFFLKNG